MKKTIFKGAATALVTPMNDDFSINYEAFGKNIDFQIESGIDALVVCGTTGESSTMSDEEHLAVIKYCIERTAGRVPVIAGTGSNDTHYATELSKEAEKLGADGLLLVTPYYNKTSQKGLAAHFSHTADAVNIPIVLYNVPSRTGININIETYKILMEHPNIVATKEASGNLVLVLQTLAECAGKLDVYSGNDENNFPIIACGGIGVISVLSNILPKEVAETARLALDGNLEEARKLTSKYLDLGLKLFLETNPIPVKAAMDLMGMNAGPGRLPLVSMGEANLKILKEAMQKAKLI
jgi:4-hydroxy-tetrahydrodipicolinate synthase